MRYLTIWGRILYLVVKWAKDRLLLLKRLFQRQRIIKYITGTLIADYR